jgi:tetratricopeptide (TPR) repeat protein
LAQSSAPPIDASAVQQLFSEGRWQEVLTAVGANATRDATLNYYSGVALAQLGRLDEARERLAAGVRLWPRDPRFPTELAGVDFKQKQYAPAARWLHLALRLDPRDTYANEFLATIYFLEGNLEAALKYWNRAGKPQVAEVKIDPSLRVKPALLDRALTFSAAEELRLADLETSQARVEGLDIFSTHRFVMASREDGRFDVSLRAQERNGWGANKWQALLSTFRGVFYQTIYPEYFNFYGSAVNVTSMLRWDSEKRRASATLSGPLRGNPKRRYFLNVDLRNENWDIRDSFQGPSPLLGSLNLRRESGSAQVTSIVSGRWSWSTGLELSHRDYRSVFAGTTLDPSLLLPGFQLKALANTRYELLSFPERRFTTSLTASSEIARVWSEPSHGFGKLQGSVESRWLPSAEGDDFEMSERISSGATLSEAPFDELFMLGLERDNDLLLRAHIATRDGRKGSAPLGNRYFLSNAEINKNLYSNGLIALRLAPFLDIGKVTDPISGLGSHKWLWDMGAQIKVRVLGVGFTFTYGKDLRSGNNAFYLSATR